MRRRKNKKYLKPLGGEGVIVIAVNLWTGERRAWSESALDVEGRSAIWALRHVVEDLRYRNRRGAKWRIDVVSTPSSIYRDLAGSRQQVKGASPYTNSPEPTVLGQVDATDLLLHRATAVPQVAATEEQTGVKAVAAQRGRLIDRGPFHHSPKSTRQGRRL